MLGRFSKIKKRENAKKASSRTLPAQFEAMEERHLLSLLGVGDELGRPVIAYDSIGVATYDAVAETFDSTALPLMIRLPGGSPRPLLIRPDRDFQLHIRVGNDANLLGGIEAQDLVITGSIDVNNDGTMDYSGVLLTGEIAAFGYLNSGDDFGADQFDFRFTPTGGELLPFFSGMDIGVEMGVAYTPGVHTPFEDDFAVDFLGHAQGMVGAIASLPPVLSAVSGQVYDDANSNGANDSEAGIAGVDVTLTGTDNDGNAVNLTTITDANGAYSFADVAAGTYTITETQPAEYLDGTAAAGTLGGVAGENVISGIVIDGEDGTGYDFGEITAGSIAGLVYLDSNGTTEALEGVTVALAGTDDRGDAVSLATQTAADGTYSFGDLRPGTYTITETQPADYLDGESAAGTLGGVAGENLISGIVVNGTDGTGYDFNEIVGATISGLVFVDFNADAVVNFGEQALEGVTVTLTGADDRGDAVEVAAQTDADGIYSFLNLRPGNYTVTETQPVDLLDGVDTLGYIEGLGSTGVAGNDVFSGVQVGAGSDALNYNFSERPEAGVAVTGGQTATIGYWQNKNGQKVIKGLNAGVNDTQLGNWLATTLPNLYGDLAGLTNGEVALHYRSVFRAKKIKGTGPRKVESQVLATALASYVTNATLAGTSAASYGFMVTEYGVGNATFSIGNNGAAFGVADYTIMTVIDMLRITDSMSASGDLYDLDSVLRTMANDVYCAINQGGDI